MRWLPALFCGLLSAASPFAHADPLAASSIPDNIHWIIHLDVDAARSTPLWELARLRLVQPRQEQVRARVEAVQRITGMNIPRDLHDITLFGTAYDSASVCILIHGAIDEKLATDFLRKDPDFASEPRNGHTILTWRDKQRGQLMHGSFARANVVLISSDSKLIGQTLDTLDGKSPALKADSPLRPPPASTTFGSAKRSIFWLAGDNLSDLTGTHKAESPLLGQMDFASVYLSCENNQAIARLRIDAKTVPAAQEMMMLGDHFRLMGARVAAATNRAPGPPRAQLLGAVLQDLSIALNDKQVDAEWTLGFDKINALIGLAKEEQATTQPATDKKP